MADYRQIQHLPGVEVAAPVAMVGYSLPVQSITVPLPPAAGGRPGPAGQLFRSDTTWVSAGGTTRVQQPASYVYLTPRPLSMDNATGASYETQGSCPGSGCAQRQPGPPARSARRCRRRRGAGPRSTA